MVGDLFEEACLVESSRNRELLQLCLKYKTYGCPGSVSGGRLPCRQSLTSDVLREDCDLVPPVPRPRLGVSALVQ